MLKLIQKNDNIPLFCFLIHRSLYPRALSKQFSTIIKCSPLYLKIIATSYIQVHVFTNIIFPSSFAPKLSYIYTNYLYVYFIYISYTILTLISHIYSYPTYFYFTFITPRDFNSPNKSSTIFNTKYTTHWNYRSIINRYLLYYR